VGLGGCRGFPFAMVTASNLRKYHRDFTTSGRDLEHSLSCREPGRLKTGSRERGGTSALFNWAAFGNGPTLFGGRDSNTKGQGKKAPDNQPLRASENWERSETEKATRGGFSTPGQESPFQFNTNPENSTTRGEGTTWCGGAAFR